MHRSRTGWRFLTEKKATLAEIAHRLGRKALEEVAAAAKPDTLLAWYRKLIAKKFDGSKFRKSVGRPPVEEEIERLVVRMARENPSWGYERIVGAMANLGHQVSDQTVGNILKRHDIPPALKRKQNTSWKEADPIWGAFSETSAAPLRIALSRGTESPGQGQPTALSFTNLTVESEAGEGAMPRATGWFAQILRARSRVNAPMNILTKRVISRVR